MKYYAFYTPEDGHIHCVMASSTAPTEEELNGLSVLDVPADTHPDTSQVVGGVLEARVPPEVVLTVADKRRNAYVALGEEDALAAIWDALDALNSVGVDVGLKAKTMLSKRASVKAAFPKK